MGYSGDPSLSRPGDLYCESRASAVGTNQCLWRPHPQDGGHKPLPEASTGQGHTCLLTCCPGRAALRKVLPLGPLAQRLTRPGEGRAGRRSQNESPRLALGGELNFLGYRKDYLIPSSPTLGIWRQWQAQSRGVSAWDQVGCQWPHKGHLDVESPFPAGKRREEGEGEE